MSPVADIPKRPAKKKEAFLSFCFSSSANFAFVQLVRGLTSWCVCVSEKGRKREEKVFWFKSHRFSLESPSRF
jgi:hypothetical protein